MLKRSLSLSSQEQDYEKVHELTGPFRKDRLS